MQSPQPGPATALLNAVAALSTTKANYWAESAVDLLLGATLVLAGARAPDIRPAGAALAVLLGLLLFSLIEYGFHRWLFHGPVEVIARGHRRHHENPKGYDGLPFFLPALVLLSLCGLFTLVVRAAYAFTLTGTIALNYVVYGVWHFTVHHHLFGWPPARDWAANHHIHHYHPDTNFGVTSPLWDVVFGTRYARPGAPARPPAP
jgi:sterol desaturase/sphingolipid hydroxylase (fatty acid hydroxylase superfamily)